MRFAEDDNKDGYRIQAYATGQVTVNDEVLTRSLVISADRLLRDWAPQRFEDLTFEHIHTAAAERPDIFLLGTGARLRFPPAALLQRLQAEGIGVEIMDTAAACRTYNVLLAESRRVCAALLMI